MMHMLVKNAGSVLVADPVIIDSSREGAVQAVISGTATVKLEGSLDGTNWHTVAEFSESGAAEVRTMRYVRANVSEWTSGTVTLMLQLEL